RPVAVAIARLDAGAARNLAVANFLGDNVTILRNAGLGGFTTVGTYDAGNGPRGFAVQDLDADGDLDLAVPNADTSQMTVLYNAGNATFSNSRAFVVGSYISPLNPQGIAAADLDKDGDADIITANRGTD